jgi:hypothetical protein
VCCRAVLKAFGVAPRGQAASSHHQRDQQRDSGGGGGAPSSSPRSTLHANGPHRHGIESTCQPPRGGMTEDGSSDMDSAQRSGLRDIELACSLAETQAGCLRCTG